MTKKSAQITKTKCVCATTVRVQGKLEIPNIDLWQYMYSVFKYNISLCLVITGVDGKC